MNRWHEFLQTPYGQSDVPDLFDELQTTLIVERHKFNTRRQNPGKSFDHWQLHVNMAILQTI